MPGLARSASPLIPLGLPAGTTIWSLLVAKFAGELVVLPTYTAMLALQGVVAERGHAQRYWERAR